MDINERIRELMKERGWTEYRLKEESDLSQSTVNNIFARGTVPKIATLEAIVKAFGMTLSQFFAEDGEAIPLTPEQRDLLSRWSSLDKKQKEALLTLMEQKQS